ncbi:MAG: hypothetical protein JW885_15580 [Deltaproteobacteria bacterium]|nr:hypothetical protein [Candidatus Zymogenaceae bacterium]
MTPSEPYSKKDLRRFGGPKALKGHHLDEVAFPIGGIGTGTLSITGRGRLIDWEIQNRPNKGSINTFCFFTLWAKERGKEPVTRVLAQRSNRGLGGSGPGHFSGIGFGANRLAGAGLPHMQHCRFRGRYPFCEISFSDPLMPVVPSVTAYNPLIPHNVDDSSIPGAVFLFHIENPTDREVEASLLSNLHNTVDGDFTNYTEFAEKDGVRGLFMTSRKEKPESPRWGSMGLFTTHTDLTHTRAWVRGAWYDNLTAFWNEVSATGRVTDRIYPPLVGDVGTLGMIATIPPGGSVTLPLYLTWSFPTMEAYWRPDLTEDNADPEHIGQKPKWTNYYAKRFPDALTAAAYLGRHHRRLYEKTAEFTDALFSSTLPEYVLDAVSSQISTIRSTSCIMLENGEFYNFEGCHAQDGCCEGSCSHVWNYTQALAFLFPSLERSLKETAYRYNLFPDGRMAFRTAVPLGVKMAESTAAGGSAGVGEAFHPAADGQMGVIMQVWREYALSGDRDWLAKLWPSVKKSLEYAWEYWDKDKDGVMEGLQHNTYDIEFYGPNGMITGMYLGALAAAVRMALSVGDDAAANEYRRLLESGGRKADEMLFNGKYFIQIVDPDAKDLSPVTTDVSMSGDVMDGAEGMEPKYQYGSGCLSDQLLGQCMATIFGLGYLFDSDHVRTALTSIFTHNWKRDLTGHASCQRVFAVEGEPGLLLCTWPNGGRPAYPFVYSDEVWTGIEYQVAVHLIAEGFIDEGLSIVKGVRARYDGRMRNPYNEMECGSHYVRALASYGLIPALSGFTFNAPDHTYGFAPKIKRENFASFWATGTAWGSYRQRITASGKTALLIALGGELEIKRLLLSPDYRGGGSVTLGGRRVDAAFEDTPERTSISFIEPIAVTPASQLLIRCGR